MTKASTYVLQVGDADLGARRLGILNRVYNPQSQTFIQNSGLKSGMRVLEVACGTGILACWMAEQVTSSGEVVGVDFSSEQLSVAAQRAKEQNLTNIKFIEKNIYDIDAEFGEFDFIHARMIFMHLTDPMTALKCVIARLKSGGILAVEEPDIDTILSYPKSAALEKMLAWFRRLNDLNELNFGIGPSVYTRFRELGLKNVKCQLIHPLLQGVEQRQHMGMLTLETKKPFIDAGVATGAEVDEVARQLYEIAEDENYLMTHMELLQTSGIK